MAASTGGKRCRKDFMFEMAHNEGAAMAWGEKLGHYLDSFGTCSSVFLMVSLLCRSLHNKTSWRKSFNSLILIAASAWKKITPPLLASFLPTVYST